MSRVPPTTAVRRTDETTVRRVRMMNSSYSSSQNRLRATAAIAALVALFSLTSCAPEAAKPAPPASIAATASPTPTPSSVAAPTSAEEALAGASAVAKRYFELRSEIRNEHPNDTTVINTVATGDAVERIKVEAARLVERGQKPEGTISYEIDLGSSTVANLETTEGESTNDAVPFGFVYISGCFDSSQVVTTNSDGTIVDPLAVPRFVLPVQVLYDAAKTNWFVVSVTATEAAVPC